MLRKLLGIGVALAVLAGPACAGCEEEFDALTKAISSPVTMAAGHRAAMMRMALSGYDHCMSGNAKYSAGIRDDLMEQLRKQLGGQ
jgi:hypothetical protein